MAGSAAPGAPENVDVAIVGAGPTGALLANLLGRAGVSAVVLEREREIHPLPRAVHFDGEIMRVFQSAGLAEAVAAIARPGAQGMRFVNAAGDTLLVRRGAPGEGPHGWAGNWYFHQPHLERALRHGLARFPSVRLFAGHEAVEVADGADRATVLVRDGETGATRRFAPRFVVGCDGARSMMRRTIGSTREDLGPDRPWLVVDLLMRPGSARAASLPEHTLQHCDPARPATAVFVGGRRRRWEIMLMPGDDPARMTDPATVWPLLARWIGPEDAEIERGALYTFHASLATGWRKGRLLLAGDACHQTPPFLGQGMCAGLRDAANLAWKLALVVKRGAPAALLDTYESERRPHAAAFIALAVRLGDIIQATDPAVAEARDRRFRAGGPELFDFPRPQLGPGLRDDAPAPVGTAMGQPVLRNGRRLDDAYGGRFVVAAPAVLLEAMSAERRMRCAALDATLHATDARDDPIGAWATEAGGVGLVLRPDGYLFGTAADAADLDRLVDRLPRCASPA